MGANPSSYFPKIHYIFVTIGIEVLLIVEAVSDFTKLLRTDMIMLLILKDNISNLGTTIKLASGLKHYL